MCESNKGGEMTQKELEFFRNLLLKMKREIKEALDERKKRIQNPYQETTSELSSFPSHEADRGTDEEILEETALHLTADANALFEIEEALNKIERGEYGICERCGKPIEIERLKIIPYAKYCLKCQKDIEALQSKEEEYENRRFREFRI